LKPKDFSARSSNPLISSTQIVNYIADENGYRPTITYEETNRGGYNNNAQQGYDSNAQGFGGY